MKNLIRTGVVVMVIVVLLTACTAGPNPLVHAPDEEGHVAGFWQGLWHGIISPITFLLSLITDSVYVFDVHNNGNWYTFGFLLGASITFGGSGGGAASKRKKR